MTVASRARIATVTDRVARLAFGALIVLSPFRARIELMARPNPPVYGDFTDLLIYWSDLALVIAIGAWLVSLVARPRSVALGPRFLVWPVAGLVIVAWLGVPLSADPIVAADNAVRLVALVALAVFVVNAIADLNQLRTPLLLMVGSQAIVAIGQFIGQRSVGLGGLGEYTLASHLGVSVVTAADGTRYLRGYGLADHPNILGGLLAIGLLLIIGIGAYRSVRTTAASAAGAAVATAVVGIGATALFVTFSRAAWLGAAVGLGVLGAMLASLGGRATLRRIGTTLLAGAIVVAPFIASALPVVAARTDIGPPIATEARSIDERAALAEAAAAIFIAHPILGVGIGTLPSAMRTADPGFAWDYQPASIVVLDIAAETGLLGALLFLAILVGPWLALVRRRGRWTPALATTSAALAAIEIVGFFDYYPWSYAAGRIWTWALLGLWVVAYRAAGTVAEKRPLPRPIEAAAHAA